MDKPYKIRALVDYPHGGSVLKDEIGILRESGYGYDFPSQKSYGVGSIPSDSYEIISWTKDGNEQYEIY